MSVIVGTERFYLRLWSRSDIEAAVRLWGDPEVTKLIGFPNGMTESQVREKLEDEIQCEKVNGVQYWVIESKENSQIYGCCGLRPFRSGIFEIGFHIMREHWGKGVAKECAEKVIQYAFEDLRCAKLFAGHNPENLPSKGLLKKLGFKYLEDRYYAPTGLHHPSYVLDNPHVT